MAMMKFGLFGINSGALADPDASVRAAQAAEAVGFDSVWTGEHVVLPDPQEPPAPAPPHVPMLDPAVALAYIAAHTSTIALATGIIILPQRNPLVLAKELASVDVVSKGRLWFGYAAGYLHQEFAALGIAFHDRGARCDEYLDAMLELWDGESPTFAGGTVRFSGIDAHPRPVQRPHPRLIVGGQSPPAFRRAVHRAPTGGTGSPCNPTPWRSASTASSGQPARPTALWRSASSSSRSPHRPGRSTLTWSTSTDNSAWRAWSCCREPAMSTASSTWSPTPRRPTMDELLVEITWSLRDHRPAG
jgi:probable F420-dependent oxidoreductase